MFPKSGMLAMAGRALKCLSLITMTKTKNSLVNNINKRKKAGVSRSKANSTISKKAYSEMQKGWPNSKKSKKESRQD